MTKLKILSKALLGATALGALTAGSAFAAGTEAGTSVKNTFSLNYEVNNVVQPEISTCQTGDVGCTTDTSTQFTVDRKIDLTVAGTGNLTVTPGAQDQQLIFTVTNTGNDIQSYLLNNPINEGSDDFDATFGAANKLYVFPSTAGTGCTDAANLIVANEYTPSSATSDVAPDAALCVVIQGDIPAVLDDADQSDVTLLAIAAQPTAYANASSPAPSSPGTAEVADVDGTNVLTGSAENVLADAQGTANESTDVGSGAGVSTGDHSATLTYIAADADLVGTKSVVVISTDGSNCGLGDIGAAPAVNDTTQYSTPGACVEYAIEVMNTGSVAADFIDIADPVSSDLENIVAKSAVFTDTDATNTVNVAVVGNQVDLTNGKLASGATGYLLIRATVK